MSKYAEQLLAMRSQVYGAEPLERMKAAEEGGCGVTGFACTVPVGGRFIYEPSVQMQNRGNGKGGGIAAVGLVPEEMGVSREVLSSHYVMQIALLDATAHADLEREFILPNFEIALSVRVPHIDDYRDIKLEVRPPDVHRYFVRVKPEVLRAFAVSAGLQGMGERELEDEFVWRNSYRLNDTYYASLGEKRAFVMCHGRDLLVFKLVGFAEQNVQYYQLEDTKAHVWIAHQRYPTKGRVWHPGGAHPFVGVERGIGTQWRFCELSLGVRVPEAAEYPAAVFDGYGSVGAVVRFVGPGVQVPRWSTSLRRWHRRRSWILTSCRRRSGRFIGRYRRRTFTRRRIGPWFFIIARSHPDKRQFQLLGITDTAMLRPQVFALAGDGEAGGVQIGLICSEKQAIDATLRSLAREDSRFCPVADRYWNARGGSVTDGGAFIFTIDEDAAGKKTMACTDKFGRPVTVEAGSVRCDTAVELTNGEAGVVPAELSGWLAGGGVWEIFEHVRNLSKWPAGGVEEVLPRGGGAGGRQHRAGDGD